MFDVASGCLLDPRTSEPVKPGALSTVVLGLSGLSLLWTLAAVAGTLQAPPEPRPPQLGLAAAVVVGVNVVAFAAYHAFWRACRPWSGWILYGIAAGAVAAFAAKAFGVAFEPPAVLTVGPPGPATA